jgi:tripartite-type tricarboxylate transporter receptor subunit TctC
MMMKRKILLSLLGACALLASPAHAQFYKDKTLALLVNYGAGGNADTEARVYQRHMGKHIPGNPTIVVQNAPGAGGLKAMNMLGLEIGARPDGLTAGYFTIGASHAMVGDPALKVTLQDDFIVIGGARGWTIVFGRKDMTPGGVNKPADFAKAQKVFFGGYSRASSHDTRLRLMLEIFGVPYVAVTGFPGTSDINKAMQQNEVNLSGSSLPGYQTQVIPNIIKPGVGVPLFHYPVMGADGKPAGNPSLIAEGIPTMDKVYEEAFGKPPSGVKFETLLTMNTVGTNLQRAILLPKGSPPAAVDALRGAFDKIGKDEAFLTEFQKITGERPEFVTAEELKPLFDRLKTIDPEVKKTLIESMSGS